MAISNVCGIDGLKQTIGTTLRIAIRDSKGDKQVFLQSIINLRNEYSTDPIEDFVNTIFDWMFTHQKMLEKKGMWMSKPDLNTLFNDSNKNESEEIQSKEEEISEDSRYFEDISDHFIEAVYGTSTAKDKMLKSFQRNLIKSLFIDLENEIEVVTNEECNEFLVDYLERLFQDLKKAFKKELSGIDSLFDPITGISNLSKINKILENKKELFTIKNLQRLSANPLQRNNFNGFNALFILNNFDRLLNHQLPKLVTINHHEGVLFNSKDKYKFNFRNSKINETWRDDDKDIDGTEEVSDVIRRLLESMNRVDLNGNVIVDSYLTFLEISSANTMLRALAHHPNAHDKIFIGKNTYTLRELLSGADNDHSVNMKKLFDVLVSPQFNYRKYGIYPKQMATIKALHRGIFANNNSLYSILTKTMSEIRPKDQQPSMYYNQVTLILGGQETIDMLEYNRLQGEMKNITLKGQQDVVQTHSIDNTIGGIFNVEIKDLQYTHFTADITSLEDVDKEEPKLEIRTGYNDELVITRYKGGKLLINGKNINEYNSTQESVQELVDLFKNNRDFFREVTRFVYDDKFINILETRQSDYANQLFKMAASIIYNYEVSKQLYNLVGPTYTENKKKYFSESENEKIKPYQHVKQLNHVNDEFTSIKIALAQTRDEYKDITRTNTLKDAEGKQISAIGLDQIATKPEQQWDRSLKDGSTPIKGFSGLKLYRGQEFGRDFKGLENKSATAFTEAENFIATFMFDYLGRMYPNDEQDKNSHIIKILPSVISDKSRIPKTLFDLNEIVPDMVTENGEPVRYKDLSTEGWQELAVSELGSYYKAIYNNFENLMSIANDSIKSLSKNNDEFGRQLILLGDLTLDYDNNFMNFNKKIQDANMIKDKAGFIKKLLHEIALYAKDTGNNFELILNLHYNISRDGKLVGNAALYDLLYRWGVINDKHSAYTAYKLNTGYGTSKQFFLAKQYQYIEDLLKDNCEILLHDSYGNAFKDKAYKELGKTINDVPWKTKDNIIFAKLNYGVITKDGVVFKTLDITSKSDLKQSYIYKAIKRMSRVNPELYNPDLLDINKLGFSLSAFMDAIKRYNETALFPQMKSLVQQALIDFNLEENVINEITQQLIESVKSGKKLSITKNMLGENVGKQTPANVAKALKNVDTSLIAQYTPENINMLNVEFVMNDHLAKYQATEFILGLEYMNATLGTHLNHPGFGKNLKEVESAAWGALVKRNVSMTASKYRFGLNRIDGIKSTYTVAVIEDDKDIVYNIFGRVDKAKPFDGATICSITSNYLENNSLGSNRAGIDKKQFIHDYKANSGSGIIVKTAGFPITNGRMRNSLMLLRLNKKMLDVEFTEPVDITRDYNGDLLLGVSETRDIVNKYGDITYVETDSQGREFIYRTVGVKYLDNNNNALIYRQVYDPAENKWDVLNDEKNGIPVLLNSNYKIWKHVFGGENSIKLHENGSYEYTEQSCEQLAYAMNYVGTKLIDGVATAQSHVDQPLKRHVIDYIITEGAIKQGAANVNSKDAYFNDDFKLSTMTLNMYDAGIQLNAEHHADDSTLSLMTLVLNALSARGYSMKEGDEVYTALRNLTKEALRGFDLGSIDIKRGDSTEMQNFIADIILRSIKTVGSSDGNLIAALSSEIKKEYASGNKVTYDLIRNNMPISMPAIFDKMVSSLASVLTLRCIRIKFPGSMNVLAPSNKIYKLYADHLLSYHKGNINNLQNKSLIDERGILQTGNIQMGRTYLVSGDLYGEQEILIDNPRDYWTLKDLVTRGVITNIEEVLRAGRDLATYGIRFTDSQGKAYNMWDLDAIKHLYNLELKLRSIVEDINEQGLSFELHNQLIEIGTEVGYYKEGDDPSKVFDVKEFKNFLMRKLQNTLSNLSKRGYVKIDGNDVKIFNMEIQPYELIATKVYETTFGLKQGDDVQDISNNKLFFVQRSLENLASKAQSINYDVELTVLNGKHVYLLNSKSEIPSGLEEIKPEYQYEGEDVVQRDLSGRLVRKVSSTRDRIFVDSKGNEIILTDNLNFYVDNTEFVLIGLSGHSDADSIKDTLSQLVFSDKTAVKSMINNMFVQDEATDLLANMDLAELEKTLEEHKDDLLSLIQQRAEKEQMAIDELRLELSKPNPNVDRLRKTNKTVRNLIDKGLEIHTSFLQSLEFLAARIPAQSHQSFMAMKIVGFDESGKNTAYVSRMQIWLQGSDYDIDKVSLLGYKFKNGHFVKWSPYMSLKSKELLEASKQLPFPNGEYAQVLDGDENLQKYMKELFTVWNNMQPDTVEKITATNDIIRYVNSLGFVPNIGNAATEILKMVNSHNSYFKKGNIKDGLINFISTSMYSVSKDPVNLIQGQSPIDDMTDIIKEEGKKKPMNEKAKAFAPGSPLSKLSMLLLTLKGKENTGIVASAMKNFEACSQYYYKVLYSGTDEQRQRLLMNVEIFGKEIRMLANAYAENAESLPSEVAEALNTVDNNTDAFLLFSAFLSLSTDNAKDPVLAKINAGPSMMSLYTAGLMLGFDVYTLIDVMTSPIAWEMSNLMNSNVFNDTQGIFNIDGIFDYIEEGPFRSYMSLGKKMKSAVKNAIYLYLKKSKHKSLEKHNVHKAEDLPDHIIKSVFKNPRFDLQKCLQSTYELEGKEENLAEIEAGILESEGKKLQEQKERLENALSSREKQKSELEGLGEDISKEDSKRLKRIRKEYMEISDKLTLIKAMQNAIVDLQNNTEFSDAQVREEMEKHISSVANTAFTLRLIDLGEAYNFTEHDDFKMRRLIKDIKKYRSFIGTANTSMVVSPFDGLKYKAIDVIKKLSHVANELARLRPVLGLNLKLPNDIASLFKFLRNFESIFEQRAAELSPNNKAVKDFKEANGDTLKISFQRFIEDKSYRDFIIKSYESMKAAVNIFDVINNSEHYLGYAEALNANIQSMQVASTSYRISNEISEKVLNEYFNVSRNGTLHKKYIKRVLKFVANRINNLFLLSQDVIIRLPDGVKRFTPNGSFIDGSGTEILLGTPHGNATFKYWMENYVIPEEQSKKVSTKFMKDLTRFSISNTLDGIGLVNYSLTENMMPKSEYERAQFKLYKDDLNSLQSQTHNGYPLLDLLFYYNLIAYNGESSQNSFTTLFEDIFAEKSNDTVKKYVDFYSIFDKEGSFELGKDFSEDELLRFIAPIENVEQGKLKYIRMYNPDTMKMELLKRKDNESLDSELQDADNPINDNGPDVNDIIDFTEEGMQTNEKNFADRVEASKYESIEYDTRPRYFTNNYYSEPSRIALSGNISLDETFGIVTISKENRTYDNLISIAKANGHGDITIEDVIVRRPMRDSYGHMVTIIDKKQTLSRIEQLLEEYC